MLGDHAGRDGGVDRAAKSAGKLHKVVQRPDVQEAHHGALAAVGVGHRFPEERQLTCLLDILHDSRDEPERVVRACVL